ncbi:unnamed protein product, partial [Ectocarpus sp. 13 AM-2016]
PAGLLPNPRPSPVAPACGGFWSALGAGAVVSPVAGEAARLEDAAESTRWGTRGLIEESSGLLLRPEEHGALLHTRRDEVVVVATCCFPMMMAFASLAVVDVRAVDATLVRRNACADGEGRTRQADDINDKSELRQNRGACISMIPLLLLSRLLLLLSRRHDCYASSMVACKQRCDKLQVW